MRMSEEEITSGWRDVPPHRGLSDTLCHPSTGPRYQGPIACSISTAPPCLWARISSGPRDHHHGRWRRATRSSSFDRRVSISARQSFNKYTSMFDIPNTSWSMRSEALLRDNNGEGQEVSSSLRLLCIRTRSLARPKRFSFSATLATLSATIDRHRS